jgi:hypothetical protein
VDAARRAPLNGKMVVETALWNVKEQKGFGTFRFHSCRMRNRFDTIFRFPYEKN